MTIKTERLLARAKKLKKKGRSEEAKKIYSEILISSPKNQEAIKEFSSLNKKIELNPTQVQIDEVMQKYSENSFHYALSKIQILIHSFPNHPLLFNICGACQKAIGSIDSAIQSFEKAIDLKPDYAEAHYNLGVAYQNINNLSDAAEKDSNYQNDLLGKLSSEVMPNSKARKITFENQTLTLEVSK